MKLSVPTLIKLRAALKCLLSAVEDALKEQGWSPKGGQAVDK